MLGYGGGRLYCVWWGFVEGFVFFFFFFLSLLLRFLDLEFVGGPVIVVVVCGNGCSSGCCGGGCSGGSWLVVTVGAMCLYIIGF